MIKHVMVVGYGTMGRGITGSFARGGHAVTVVSRDPARIADLPAGVTAVAELPTAAPDLIIESIPEERVLKQQLFARLERSYGGAPILATNTSGLPLDQLAAPLSHPDRFIGIHYFQPAEAFPCVEVIRVAATSEASFSAVRDALRRNGQEPIVVNKPIPGFLGNRLQHAMLHEAFCLIEQGVASAADIDRWCKTLFGPRLCVTGLIEQKDLSGLHITAATQRNLVPLLDHSGQPARILQNRVANGQLGAKTGQGFYDWRGRDVAAYQRQAAEKLARILAILAEQPAD